MRRKSGPCEPVLDAKHTTDRNTSRTTFAASAFLSSPPPGLARPAAHETMLLCGRVVGTEVGIPLVR
jgi:hypothetical protein